VRAMKRTTWPGCSRIRAVGLEFDGGADGWFQFGIRGAARAEGTELVSSRSGEAHVQGAVTDRRTRLQVSQKCWDGSDEADGKAAVGERR